MKKIRFQRGKATPRTTAKIVLIVVASIVALALILIGAGKLENHLSRTTSTNKTDANVSIATDHGATLTWKGTTYCRNEKVKSYLLLGVDVSDQQNSDWTKQGYVADMADNLILVVVNEQKKCYTMLQLDRNTVTEIKTLYPDGSVAEKDQLPLCYAFFYGHDMKSACENEMDAVSGLLKGIPIDGYAAFTMNSMKTINHLVGGVTVTMDHNYSNLDSAMVKGATLTLTDKQAELFLHSRKNADNGTNEARMTRQRIYLAALKQKIRAKAESDGKFPLKFYSGLADDMTTSMKVGDFNTLASMLLRYQDSGIVTLNGNTKTNDTLGDGITHEEFHPDKNNLMATVIRLFYIQP